MILYLYAKRNICYLNTSSKHVWDYSFIFVLIRITLKMLYRVVFTMLFNNEIVNCRQNYARVLKIYYLSKQMAYDDNISHSLPTFKINGTSGALITSL